LRQDLRRDQAVKLHEKPFIFHADKAKWQIIGSMYPEFSWRGLSNRSNE
jgi:hypothetical protein